MITPTGKSIKFYHNLRTLYLRGREQYIKRGPLALLARIGKICYFFTMKSVRAHLLITGRVQGVYFRASTVEVSTEEGITGWVRNRTSGDVEAVLEGEKSAVERVIKWCRSGPPMASVSDVIVTWEDYKGEFNDFTER